MGKGIRKPKEIASIFYTLQVRAKTDTRNPNKMWYVIMQTGSSNCQLMFQVYSELREHQIYCAIKQFTDHISLENNT